MEAFKPFFAIVNGAGELLEATSSFEEGLDITKYLAERQNSLAFVDGNAVPSTRNNPDRAAEEATSIEARKATAAAKLPKVTGAWATMDWKVARKRLVDSAKYFYAEILKATEGTGYRGRKGGISEALRSTWFDPGAKAGIFRENAKTAKVLEGVDTKYASRGVSFLPHHAGFLRPFDISTSRYPAGGTFCLGSVPECRNTCLVFTGQRKLESGAYAASWLFTQLLRKHPEEVLCWIRQSALAWCNKTTDVNLFFRLNVFSDIPWELYAPGFLEQVVEDLRGIHGLPPGPESGWMFYDYTKLRSRTGIPDVYDITFSFTGYRQNTEEFVSILNGDPGVAPRAAVVFLRRETGGKHRYRKDPGKPLKTKEKMLPFTFFGHRVWNGDKSDIRPLDPEDVRVVGLVYKPAKYKVFAEDGKTFNLKDFVPPEELDEKMGMFLVRVVQPDPEAPPVVAAMQDRASRTYLPVLD
jgi:hypothetical protein